MRFSLFTQLSKLTSLVIGAGLLASCNLQLANIEGTLQNNRIFGVQKNYIIIESLPQFISFNQKFSRTLAANNYQIVDKFATENQLINIIDTISTDNYIRYLTSKLGQLSDADYRLIAQQVSYNRQLGQELRAKYTADPFNFGDYFNNVKVTDIPSVYRNIQKDPRDYQRFFDQEYGAQASVEKLAQESAVLINQQASDNKSQATDRNAESIISKAELSPAAKLIKTQNNVASFIPRIETCRINLTYKCVADYVPKIAVHELHEDNRSLSLLPNSTITAQGVLVFAVTATFSSKYFSPINISTATQELYINTEYAPVANIKRVEVTRDASYVDLSEKLINKIQYILRQPEISNKLFENYYATK